MPTPEISRITLPTGTSYDIKDAYARDAIAHINSFTYVVSKDAATTPYGIKWTDDGTEITGTLVPSTETVSKIYLVHQRAGVRDVYDEYITITVDEQNYVWERFGSTDADIDNLGALAYKDTATTTYSPSGEVSQPSFTGSELTSTGNVTAAGSVSAPTITVTPTSSTKYVASSSTGGGTVTSGTAASCTLPTLTTSVVNENLTLSWNAGSFTANTPTAVTLPSFESATVVSGIDSATATQPTFTGESVSVSVSGTPSGTVSKPNFTGTSSTITVS